MHWSHIQTDWKQWSGKVREEWGMLTDADVQAIGGKRDLLIGKIQQRYGVPREEAERQIRNWIENVEAEHPR